MTRKWKLAKQRVFLIKQLYKTLGWGILPLMDLHDHIPHIEMLKSELFCPFEWHKYTLLFKLGQVKNRDAMDVQLRMVETIHSHFKAIRIAHYGDVIMRAMASQITSLRIVFSNVYFKRRSKETSKLCVTGLCAGNSPATGEFPAQRASNAENVSIWRRHHGIMHSDSC